MTRKQRLEDYHNTLKAHEHLLAPFKEDMTSYFETLLEENGQRRRASLPCRRAAARRLQMICNENLTVDVCLDGERIGQAFHVGSNKWEVHPEPVESSSWTTTGSLDEAVDKLLEVFGNAPDAEDEEGDQ